MLTCLGVFTSRVNGCRVLRVGVNMCLNGHRITSAQTVLGCKCSVFGKPLCAQGRALGAMRVVCGCVENGVYVSEDKFPHVFANRS